MVGLPQMFRVRSAGSPRLVNAPLERENVSKTDDGYIVGPADKQPGRLPQGVCHPSYKECKGVSDSRDRVWSTCPPPGSAAFAAVATGVSGSIDKRQVYCTF